MHRSAKLKSGNRKMKSQLTIRSKAAIVFIACLLVGLTTVPPVDASKPTGCNSQCCMVVAKPSCCDLVQGQGCQAGIQTKSCELIKAGHDHSALSHMFNDLYWHHNKRMEPIRSEYIHGRKLTVRIGGGSGIFPWFIASRFQSRSNSCSLEMP